MPLTLSHMGNSRTSHCRRLGINMPMASYATSWLSLPLERSQNWSILRNDLMGSCLLRRMMHLRERGNATIGPNPSIELQRFHPQPGKFIAELYLGTSKIWHTVTPVILDGHNKKSKSDNTEAIAKETEKLICKGLDRTGIETQCTFAWQSTPFFKNCLSAHEYDREGPPYRIPPSRSFEGPDGDPCSARF